MLRWTAGTRARAEREWRECKPYAPWLNHPVPLNYNNMEYDARSKRLQSQSVSSTINKEKVNACVHDTQKECLPSEEESKSAQVDNRALPVATLSSSSSTAAKAELLVREMLEAKQRRNNEKNVEQQESRVKDNNTTTTSANTNAKESQNHEFTFAHEKAWMRKANMEHNKQKIDEREEKEKKYSLNEKIRSRSRSDANNCTNEEKYTAANQLQVKRQRENQRINLSADEIALQWPLRQRWSEEEHQCKRYRHGLVAPQSRPSSCISSHSSNFSSISTRAVQPNLKTNARNMNMQCKKIIKEEQLEELLENKLHTTKQNDVNVIYDDYLSEDKPNKYKKMNSSTNNDNYVANKIKMEEMERELEPSLALPSLTLESLQKSSPSSSSLSYFSSSVIVPESKMMSNVTDDINNIFCTEESREPAAAVDETSQNNDCYTRLEYWHEGCNNEFDWKESNNSYFSLPYTTNLASPHTEIAINDIAEYSVANNLHDSYPVLENEYCGEQKEKREEYSFFNKINSCSGETNKLYVNNRSFNVNSSEQYTPFVDNPLIDVICDNLTEPSNVNNIFDYSCKKGNSYINEGNTKHLEISPTCWEEQQQQWEESPALHDTVDFSDSLHSSEPYGINFECGIRNKYDINECNLFDAIEESANQPSWPYAQNISSNCYNDRNNMYVHRTALPTNRVKHVKLQTKVKDQNREPYKYNGGISERSRQFRERCRRRKRL